jgi:hypothetical protein
VDVVRRGALSLLVLVAAGCAAEPTRPAGPDSLSVVCGESEIAVAVGESVRPAARSNVCRLRAAPGAEYALAFLDPSAVRSAETSREEWFPGYIVSLTVDGTSTDAASPAVAARDARLPTQAAGDVVQAAASDVVETAASSVVECINPLSSPEERSCPWSLNERFEMIDPYRGSYKSARVLRIYGGEFVVAWFEQGDSARLLTWLPRLDSAFEVVQNHAFPLLRSTFVDAAPRTSTGSGQYLILTRDSLPVEGAPSSVGLASSATVGDTAFTWIYLKVDTAYTHTGLASLLAHEMVHSYQRMYMHATRGSGAESVTGAALWGTEGGANLISYETMRRYAGMPLDANLDWRVPQATVPAQFVARRAQPASGEFTAGYDNAMGFLRYLVLRLMRAGSTLDRAVREVSRGAIEGWYGYDGYTRRTGLVSRVRAVLGDRWNPEEALLDWTLSHAADDLTGNPDFQDRTSLRIWDIPSDRAGWRASADLTSAEGGNAEIWRRYGSPFYVYLRDGGAGVEFRIAAFREISNPNMPGTGLNPMVVLPWKLVRIR